MTLEFYTVTDFKDWVFKNDVKIYVYPDPYGSKVLVSKAGFFDVQERLGNHFYDNFWNPICIYADSKSLEVILPNHLNVN